MASLLGSLVLAGSALCLTGCANVGYYWQSASGHIRMLQAAKPVEDTPRPVSAPHLIAPRSGRTEGAR